MTSSTEPPEMYSIIICLSFKSETRRQRKKEKPKWVHLSAWNNRDNSPLEGHSEVSWCSHLCHRIKSQSLQICKSSKTRKEQPEYGGSFFCTVGDDLNCNRSQILLVNRFVHFAEGPQEKGLFFCKGRRNLTLLRVSLWEWSPCRVLWCLPNWVLGLLAPIRPMSQELSQIEEWGINLGCKAKQEWQRRWTVWALSVGPSTASGVWSSSSSNCHQWIAFVLALVQEEDEEWNKEQFRGTRAQNTMHCRLNALTFLQGFLCLCTKHCCCEKVLWRWQMSLRSQKLIHSKQEEFPAFPIIISVMQQPKTAEVCQQESYIQHRLVGWLSHRDLLCIERAPLFLSDCIWLSIDYA